MLIIVILEQAALEVVRHLAFGIVDRRRQGYQGFQDFSSRCIMRWSFGTKPTHTRAASKTSFRSRLASSGNGGRRGVGLMFTSMVSSERNKGKHEASVDARQCPLWVKANMATTDVNVCF